MTTDPAGDLLTEAFAAVGIQTIDVTPRAPGLDLGTSEPQERHELRQRDGCRFRCRATVERFGTKRAYKGDPIPTILLRGVVCSRTGTLLADHLWFTAGKWSASLTPGAVFEFEARSADYIKGYRGRREIDDAPPVSRDWKLQRPTKVRILTATQREVAAVIAQAAQPETH